MKGGIKYGTPGGRQGKQIAYGLMERVEKKGERVEVHSVGEDAECFETIGRNVSRGGVGGLFGVAIARCWRIKSLDVVVFHATDERFIINIITIIIIRDG